MAGATNSEMKSLSGHVTDAMIGVYTTFNEVQVSNAARKRQLLNMDRNWLIEEIKNEKGGDDE